MAGLDSRAAHKVLTTLLEGGSGGDLARLLATVSEAVILSYVKNAADAGEYRPLARIIVHRKVFPDGVVAEATDRMPAALNAALLKAYMGRDVARLEALRGLLDRLGGLQEGDRRGQRELARDMLAEMRSDYSAFVKKGPEPSGRPKLKR